MTWQNNTAAPGVVTMSLSDNPTVHSYTITTVLQPGETRTMTVYGYVNTGGSISSSGQGGTVSFVGFGLFGQVDESNCEPPSYGDGRINALDVAAPLAAYCANGGITVWDIDANSQGTLAFSASLDAIHAALIQAQSSGQNVMIGQGLGDSLYALASNQLELTGPDLKEPGKLYSFITTGDRCG